MIPADTPVGTKVYVYMDSHDMPYAWIGEAYVIAHPKGGVALSCHGYSLGSAYLTKAEAAVRVMGWAIETVKEGVIQIEEMHAIIAGGGK